MPGWLLLASAEREKGRAFASGWGERQKIAVVSAIATRPTINLSMMKHFFSQVKGQSQAVQPEGNDARKIIDTKRKNASAFAQVKDHAS